MAGSGEPRAAAAGPGGGAMADGVHGCAGRGSAEGRSREEVAVHSAVLARGKKVQGDRCRCRHGCLGVEQRSSREAAVRWTVLECRKKGGNGPLPLPPRLSGVAEARIEKRQERRERQEGRATWAGRVMTIPDRGKFYVR